MNSAAYTIHRSANAQGEDIWYIFTTPERLPHYQPVTVAICFSQEWAEKIQAALEHAAAHEAGNT